MSQVLDQQEQNRLAEESAARADAELNRVYKRVLASLKSSSQAGALKAAQNAWIGFRDAEVALAGAQFGDGSGQRAVVGGTKARLTQERVTSLLLVLAGPSVLGEVELAPADALLNRLWKTLEKRELGATERLKAQRAWLKFRDSEVALWKALGGRSTAMQARLTWERCGHLESE